MFVYMNYYITFNFLIKSVVLHKLQGHELEFVDKVKFYYNKFY
jgi:hypothetical protein